MTVRPAAVLPAPPCAPAKVPAGFHAVVSCAGAFRPTTARRILAARRPHSLSLASASTLANTALTPSPPPANIAALGVGASALTPVNNSPQMHRDEVLRGVQHRGVHLAGRMQPG